jgi:nardilysin
MMKLYEKVLIFNLKKKLAQASSAGYSVTSANDRNGISLTFQGYNEKMSLLVDTTTKFMPKAVNETEASTLNVLKNEMKDSFYEQLRTSQGLNGDVMAKILLDGHYPKFELYDEIENISYEKLRNFTMEFFRALKVQVLVQGNMLKSETLNITNLVLTNLDCEKLNEEFEIKSRCYEMPLGETVLRVKSLLLNDDNSILRDFYQIGRDKLRDRCLARLVVAILNPKAYDYLRSKEQLGYGVGVQFEEKGRVIGVNVVVLSQESKHTYEEVGRKMKVFMNEVAKKTIEELTDDEFQNFKEARIKLLSAEDLDLDTEIKRNWYEINDQEYKFDRNELAVKLTKSFTKSEFQEFFKTFFLSENVRKLRLQIIGNKTTSNLIPGDVSLNYLTEKLDEDEKLVTDIKAFQRSLNLYSIGYFEM